MYDSGYRILIYFITTRMTTYSLITILMQNINSKNYNLLKSPLCITVTFINMNNNYL